MFPFTPLYNLLLLSIFTASYVLATLYRYHLLNIHYISPNPGSATTRLPNFSDEANKALRNQASYPPTLLMVLTLTELKCLDDLLTHVLPVLLFLLSLQPSPRPPPTS